jgi:hypothetical protein
MNHNQPMHIGKPAAGAQMSCAICLNLHGQHTPAVTLIHGYAVCQHHTDLVSQPEFDIFTLHGKGIRPL